MAFGNYIQKLEFRAIATAFCDPARCLGTYRDLRELAIEAATRLKTKSPHAEVTVRDLETGKSASVKHPFAKGGPR